MLPVMVIGVSSIFPPSKNDTEPLIVPGVVDVTVAVNVTPAPTVDGFGVAVSIVVVAAVPAVFTTCETTGDVSAEYVAFPPYCAVIECVPAKSVLVISDTLVLPEPIVC